MAQEKDGKDQGGGMMGFIIPLVLLALLGGGAGAGYSLVMLKPQPPAEAVPEAAAGDKGHDNDHGKDAKHGKKDAHGGDHGKAAAKPAGDGHTETVVSLNPILVTLSNARQSFVRAELAVVFGQKLEGDQSLLIADMTSDLTKYLSTVSLDQIDSAAGLEFLREDLSEVVQLRSKGKARGIVLKSLMVE